MILVLHHKLASLNRRSRVYELYEYALSRELLAGSEAIGMNIG